jgi:hypothetical protein
MKTKIKRGISRARKIEGQKYKNNLRNNKQYWEELIASCPFTTFRVFHAGKLKKHFNIYICITKSIRTIGKYSGIGESRYFWDKLLKVHQMARLSNQVSRRSVQVFK